MRRIPLVLLIAALAGCGSPHPATFTQDYDDALAPAADVDENSFTDPARLREAARAFDESVGRLRELEAPEGTQDELAAVTSALAKLADNLATVAKAYDEPQDWMLEAFQVNAERLTEADEALRAELAQLGVP